MQSKKSKLLLVLKTSLKKWTNISSIFIGSIWTRYIGRMLAISPGVEFLRSLPSFKKRKKHSSSYVRVLHRRFRVVVVQSCNRMYGRQWNVLKSVFTLSLSSLYENRNRGNDWTLERGVGTGNMTGSFLLNITPFILSILYNCFIHVTYAG